MKYYLWFYIFLWGVLSSCKAAYKGNTTSMSFYKPGEASFAMVDSTCLAEIFPYKDSMEKVMDEVLANSDRIMEKGKPESALGNFVADACLEMANERYKPVDGKIIDFCILNNGGLRSGLPKGPVTRKNVFELMPFENELVVLTVTGITVSKLLDYISEKGGVPVSNLRMKISGTTFSDAYIGNQLFNPSGTYKILTSDYLAFGGDSMEMLKERTGIDMVDLKVRDAIIGYMIVITSRHETLNTEMDGRISK